MHHPDVDPTACTLCPCTATGEAFGFRVCEYHEHHGEGCPSCPVCGIGGTDLEVPDVDDLVLAELMVWRDQVIATGYELVELCMEALERFEAVQIPPATPAAGGTPGSADPSPDAGTRPAIVAAAGLPAGPLSGLDRLAAIDAIRAHLRSRFPDRPRLALAYVRGHLRRSRGGTIYGAGKASPGLRIGAGLAVATDDELRGMLAELEVLEASIGSPT